MPKLDMVRLRAFEEAHLTKEESNKLERDLNTLRDNNITIHIPDINMVFETEDVLDYPGTELIKIVENAINSIVTDR